ncbi:MAG: CBS domain-containing protein [Nitrospirae bacterium]|nr:CBS domain-containing protein [Candidatus Manganitrophaceae bacterium]
MRLIDLFIKGKSISEMTASYMMERNVVCCNKEVNCHDLSDILYKRGFGSIPIVDDESILIGLVSEYDLLNAIKKGMHLRKTPAFEVMTEEVVSVREDTPMAEVIKILQANHFIRVPVVDATGKLIGIVARGDILGAYYESNFGALSSA